MYSGYKWNDNNIISSIHDFVKEKGHFPKKGELIACGKNGLVHAIQRGIGGLKKCQKLCGYEQYYNDEGYWNTKENTINELKKAIVYFKRFPSVTEIVNSKFSKIMIGVYRNGGIEYFRDLMGYKDDFKTYISYKSSYVNFRGRKTEKLILEILTDYCNLNGLDVPLKNVKLSKGNIIEFVCNTNKKIGIDVTNTKTNNNVYRKWTKKDYHKYLDELWIVIVSDSFNEEDYRKWNEDSPSNVYIMSVEDFCNELQYDLDESMKNTIDKYKKCTFHTRDKFKKEKRSRS